jgi:hypothetical protein
VSASERTPTEYLVLEVLAARYRLGEHTWTFPTRLAPQLRGLEDAGLLGFKPGVAEGSYTAWLTDAGTADAMSDTYQPPRYRPVGAWRSGELDSSGFTEMPPAEGATLYELVNGDGS